MIGHPAALQSTYSRADGVSRAICACTSSYRPRSCAMLLAARRPPECDQPQAVLETERVAVFCFERDHHRCHRALNDIADLDWPPTWNWTASQYDYLDLAAALAAEWAASRTSSNGLCSSITRR